MVCCVLLSMLIAVSLWLARRLPPRSMRPDRNPLAWRPYGRAVAAVPEPARSALQGRLRSFGFAVAGLRFMLRSEPNARIHLAATVLVVGAGLLLGLDPADWRWIAVAVLWVWCAEALNTGLEKLCDVVSPGQNESVRVAKDVAAGAVLVSAIAAAILGAVTLMPYVAPLAAGSALDATICRAAP